ncbi:uncharacterized protein LOC143144448 [Ptiloglossa arizonensis]|uniref:uncharacterized protein LOC143144448 n=1 Tax=Ptiloglossa arizonensis TaxID=3350558 RepID=UPI003F9ED5A0
MKLDEACCVESRRKLHSCSFISTISFNVRRGIRDNRCELSVKTVSIDDTKSRPKSLKTHRLSLLSKKRSESTRIVTVDVAFAPSPTSDFRVRRRHRTIGFPRYRNRGASP